MPPVNPAGSSGYICRPESFPVPFEHTEEGLEALAARVPAKPDADALDKAADSVIANITGANVPEGTDDEEAGDDIP